MDRVERCGFPKGLNEEKGVSRGGGVEDMEKRDGLLGKEHKSQILSQGIFGQTYGGEFVLKRKDTQQVRGIR